MPLMSRFTHPNLADVSLSSVLHALSDSSRLAMIGRLQVDRDGGGVGLACSEAACAGLPRATMSNHYTILRSAGLIESRKAGVQVLNRLRREDLDARFPGLLDAVLAANTLPTR